MKRLLLAGLMLISMVVYADYGAGLGYAPKYGPDFSHFDYVNPAAPKGGRLMLGAVGSFDSLNPYAVKGDPAEGSSLVFESLMAQSWDEPFSVYGLLADDMTLAPDGLSVHFHLNPAARFADGLPVTAEDVAFSYKTMTGRLSKPYFRFYYADVAGVDVLDRQTVRFRFARRNRELHLILGQMPVFPARWVGNKPFDQIGLQSPLGSGPYLLDRYELGKAVRYRRNPAYWGRNLPVRRGQFNFDEIEYRYYRDETVRLEAFKAGEYDVSFENSSKLWATAYDGPAFREGRIRKAMLPDASPAGMQGFGFNLRRPLFADSRVRQALALAFDFEWANRMLFYGQYVRNDSYFANSEMQARGVPQGAERALLERFRAQLPASVFQAPPVPPSTAAPHSLRENLRAARALLAAAGWTYRDGALRNARGEAFVTELLLSSKAFERVAAPWARNLEKLGIRLNYRVVDPSLFQKRLQRFDFDLMVTVFPASISPGNELADSFSSVAAQSEESRNYLGIADPVVDALIQEVLQAKDRAALVAACRALDRVLLAGHYLVPNWYINRFRLAWWHRFGQPATLPLYYDPISWAIQTWWVAPAKP